MLSLPQHKADSSDRQVWSKVISPAVLVIAAETLKTLVIQYLLEVKIC